MLPFYIAKSVLSYVSADWSMQTSGQAKYKAQDKNYRARHVAIVAGSQAAAAMSARVSWRNRFLYVAINAVTHYVADGVQMPKIVDQAFHIAVALVTAYLLKED